jgi:hypothetical protein
LIGIDEVPPVDIVAMIALADRSMLAAVCLTAVIGKVAGRDRLRAFGRTLAAVGVPRHLLGPVGATVVAAEATVAALAPWPSTGRAAALLATGLFAALTAGVAVAVRNGSTAACRCFGSRGSRLGRAHVIRNATLTALAALAVALPVTSVGDPVVMAAAIGTAAIGTLVIVNWENTAVLFR